MKINLKDFSLEELEEYFETAGEKKYRAEQVFKWIYKGACSFDEMSDIPVDLRERLKGTAEISAIYLMDRLISESDGTRKYLFALPDGNNIESVFMKYKFGNSVCVSSQAGCKRGCVFCASGRSGFARDLTAGEMADQIVKVQNDTGEKINHVVVMGVGEPFDNYDNLAKFIRIINDKRGLNIGMRNITVSTSGIIPRIKCFSNDFPQVNLAVSLHAVNGEERNKLMPGLAEYGYEELIKACRDHSNKTGRRVTLEYALISGFNDDVYHADELASKLAGMLCLVNLIPLNSIIEAPYAPGAGSAAELFLKRLKRRGIEATLRRGLGCDISAACGQLRSSVNRGGKLK